MSGFCEIKLAQPLDNSLQGETLPSVRIFSNDPIKINLSVLYSYADQDTDRFIYSRKNSILYNKIDYRPNYYYEDIESTSKENFDSLQSHRNNILPFSEFKSEENKKLKTFNTTAYNARFSGKISRSLGSEGTIYFNGPEPDLFSDIDFKDLHLQVVKDNFHFTRITGTKFISKLDYPYYVNNYTINKMGSSIYPFNTLEELQLSFITIYNLYGIKASLGSASSRIDGSNPVSYLLRDYSEITKAEDSDLFDDNSIPRDLYNKNEREFTYKFNSFFDRESGATVYIKDTAGIAIEKETNDIYFSNEDVKTIKPFDESNLSLINNTLMNLNKIPEYTDHVEFNEDLSIFKKLIEDDNKSEYLQENSKRFTAAGYNIDYSQGSSRISRVFADELD